MKDTQKKLFMIMLGCTPKGRYTEQHDIFFGIASTLKDLIPEIIDFWPEANGEIHIDAWREVKCVDGHSIKVVNSSEKTTHLNTLFFINLGGYKKNEFDELHYKILTASNSKAEAIKKAKETAFYAHNSFKGAESHIDDKYGVDVDDIFNIEDVLNPATKSKFKLQITQAEGLTEDEIHLGYLPLKNIK